MTATDELRKLLDERGVEYVANHWQTWWRFGTGGHAFAVNDGPTLCVALTGATAAQAIEATLGRGETERENAKLRELCGELWDGYNDPRCEDCPLKDKPVCADCPICAREAAVIDRMRELGIEVVSE